MRKTLKILAAVVMTATVTLPELASAAAVCTRSDIRQLNSMISRLDAAERAFNNSKIKNICPAGRRALAELQRAERTYKSRPKCTLATSKDHRDFARVQRSIRQVERELKKAC